MTRRATLDQIIRRLYCHDRLSMAKIADRLAADHGLEVAPENVKYRLTKMGVRIRDKAAAQALRSASGTKRQKRTEDSYYGPVPKRPLAELPVRDASGIAYPTRERLMAGR